jgi:membrane protein DedA with SNARE-associated domain
VEELLRQLLEQTSGGAAYVLVFVVLMACGMGVPLPEDVSLILGGYLVHLGQAKLYFMMATGYAGIMVGDSMIFLAGLRFGSKVGQRPGGLVGRIITPEKRAKVQHLFSRHGEKIVFIARFMPGVRAVTYFTAGSVHMKYWHFLLFDGVAALVSAPLFVWLGFHFGGELQELIHNVRRGQTRVLLVLGALIVGYVAFRVWRSRKDKAEAKGIPLELPDASAGLPVAPPAPREPSPVEKKVPHI